MVLSGSLLVAAPSAAFANGHDEGCGWPGHGGRVVNHWPGHGGKVVHHRPGHGGRIGRGHPNHGGHADCD
jgi:hypothetical protein